MDKKIFSQRRILKSEKLRKYSEETGNVIACSVKEPYDWVLFG